MGSRANTACWHIGRDRHERITAMTRVRHMALDADDHSEGFLGKRMIRLPLESRRAAFSTADQLPYSL